MPGMRFNYTERKLYGWQCLLLRKVPEIVAPNEPDTLTVITPAGILKGW